VLPFRALLAFNLGISEMSAAGSMRVVLLAALVALPAWAQWRQEGAACREDGPVTGEAADTKPKEAKPAPAAAESRKTASPRKGRSRPRGRSRGARRLRRKLDPHLFDDALNDYFTGHPRDRRRRSSSSTESVAATDETMHGRVLSSRAR